MPGKHLKFDLLVIAVVACLLASPCSADQHRSSGKKQAKPQQPTPPPTPPTLEQMPATAPQIIFDRGELSIVAENSTLGDILRGVRAQTGASVDVPGNATERVVGRFGPGPARDVVASLLNGSHFNFVLLGSATNSDALERVILMSKSNLPEEPPQQQANAGPVAQQPVQSTVAMDNGEAAADQVEEIQDTDVAAEDQNVQGDDQSQPAIGQNGQPNVKTPEQLLQELQRQQQIQQQQQQQQQGGAPQGFPPPPGMQPGTNPAQPPPQ